MRTKNFLKIHFDRYDYEAMAGMVEKDRGFIEYEKDDQLVGISYEVNCEGHVESGDWWHPADYVTDLVRVNATVDYAYEGEDEADTDFDERQFEDAVSEMIIAYA